MDPRAGADLQNRATRHGAHGGSADVTPAAPVSPLRAVVEDQRVNLALLNLAGTVTSAIDSQRFGAELSRAELSELEFEVKDALQSAVLEVDQWVQRDWR